MNGSTGEILFEKFEILEYLKKDENTTVYLANHIYLNKKIVLKALDTSTLPGDVIADRFKREAKILAHLDHPNIINVIDFGNYNNFSYISFEYFESVNLRKFISGNTLSQNQKEELFIQLLKGLSYAHSHGIIHRDLKPENILVDKNSKLKISDFGLAISLKDDRVTKQTSVVGTPSYMSPEQIQGEQLTVQSDLFSAGIIGYEIFTGKNPFMGEDVNHTLNKILNFNEEVFIPLSSLPDKMNRVLKKLLKKELQKRYKSANAVLSDLGIEIEYTTIRKEKDNWYKKPAILIPAVVIILLVFSILIVLNNPTTEPVESTKVINLPDKKLEAELVDNQQQNLPESGSKNEELSADNPAESAPETKDGVKVLETVEDTQNPNEENKAAGTGYLVVEVNPWARLFIDSELIGATPLSNEIEISEGEHEIILEHPDFPEYKKTITIADGETKNLKVSLDTLYGYLFCRVNPWGNIYINDKLFAQTPLQKPIKLIPGNYKLSIQNPQFGIKEEDIIITRKDTLQVIHKF